MSHQPGDVGTQCHLVQFSGMGGTFGEAMKPHASCPLPLPARVSQPEAPSSPAQAEPGPYPRVSPG